MGEVLAIHEDDGKVAAWSFEAQLISLGVGTVGGQNGSERIALPKKPKGGISCGAPSDPRDPRRNIHTVYIENGDKRVEGRAWFEEHSIHQALHVSIELAFRLGIIPLGQEDQVDDINRRARPFVMVFTCTMFGWKLLL